MAPALGHNSQFGVSSAKNRSYFSKINCYYILNRDFPGMEDVNSNPLIDKIQLFFLPFRSTTISPIMPPPAYSIIIEQSVSV